MLVHLGWVGSGVGFRLDWSCHSRLLLDVEKFISNMERPALGVGSLPPHLPFFSQPPADWTAEEDGDEAFFTGKNVIL